LEVTFPAERTTVIRPGHAPAIPDERAALLGALRQPLGAAPLREWITAQTRVCISFSDITRATPNERIIPWLLEELSFVPRQNLTLVNQLGTHRPNTAVELRQLLTPAVFENYRVVNHAPEKSAELVTFGVTREGVPARINRHVAEADLRIVTGFIEPHFFAGFSGGPKGIMPGTAGLETVMSNHRTANIVHPQATFGITEGNPLWEELRDIALRVGPTFLLNVTLNPQRQITNVFAGDLLAAHRAGCEFVRRSAMQAVEQMFDVVVVTNSGYPLDMNFYQAVKGMSAGARILKPGGTMILVAECSEGIPPGSPLDRLLRGVKNPGELLTAPDSPATRQSEQWTAQVFAKLWQQFEILIHSRLSESDVIAMHLKPCDDIGAEVIRRLDKLGAAARVAVLPHGPLTVPYLSARPSDASSIRAKAKCDP
jgi:nickel-dependent lactate racemase